jgi:hypothetical protein
MAFEGLNAGLGNATPHARFEPPHPAGLTPTLDGHPAEPGVETFKSHGMTP